MKNDGEYQVSRQMEEINQKEASPALSDEKIWQPNVTLFNECYTANDIPSAQVTDLWEAAAQVQSVEQFKTWIRREVREVLPHGAMACGYGRVHAAGVSMGYVLTVDYPVEHLAAIRNSAGCFDTPLMRRWMQRRTPVLFDVADPWPDVTESWLAQFQKHHLINAAVHANYDELRCLGTYFSFHRLPGPLGQTQRAILAGITPLLHETLLRVISFLESESFPGWKALSEREQQIALGIGRGQSNFEIAEALKIAENTVKHHVVSILKKTGAMTRARLMALITNERNVNSTAVL